MIFNNFRVPVSSGNSPLNSEENIKCPLVLKKTEFLPAIAHGLGVKHRSTSAELHRAQFNQR